MNSKYKIDMQRQGNAEIAEKKLKKQNKNLPQA